MTGAGVSAESGVPTFRGAGGYWRKYQATDLATTEAFERDPSLVWEFYHYRRDFMGKCSPNPAHYAIAALETKLKAQGKEFLLLTQNIDRLHHAAGSKNLLEIHGSLWVLRCTVCEKVTENRTQPLCPALKDRGSPEENTTLPPIPTADLPSCSCGGLLRPHVVWFGEHLDTEIMAKSHAAINACDLFIVVGTSAIVYPAAAWAPMAASRGVPTIEINLEKTANTDRLMISFQAKAGELLPTLFNISPSELLKK